VRLAPELAWQTIDGEGVVVDLPRRRMLGLNPTASFIWERVGQASEDDIAAEMARAFEVEPAQARDDVRAFLAEIEARGFLKRD
jgi:hypothetical protein